MCLCLDLVYGGYLLSVFCFDFFDEFELFFVFFELFGARISEEK